ncbi:MAG: hypothetical protein WA215_09240 [Candidatus Cybelea sp.]
MYPGGLRRATFEAERRGTLPFSFPKKELANNMTSTKTQTAFALAMALAALSACAGGSPTGGSQMPFANAQADASAAITHTRIGRNTANFTYVTSATGTSAVATCPSGYEVVGGGFSNGTGSNIAVSHFTSTDDGWKSSAINNQPVTSFAVCLSPPLPPSEYITTAFTNQFNAVAQCTNTSTFELSGGGFKYNSSGPTNSYLEDTVDWIIASTDQESGDVYGVCLKNWVADYEVAYVPSQDSTATCSSPLVAIGGGWQSNNWPGVVTLSRFTNDHSGWHVKVTGTNLKVMAYAACAVN